MCYKETMGSTEVYKMVLTIIPCLFLFLCPISNIETIFMHILFSDLSKAVHWWLPLKPPLWSGGEEGFHTTPMVQYWSVPEDDEGRDGQSSTSTSLKLQRPSTWMKAQYSPSTSAVFQMSCICLYTIYDANFERFYMLHVDLAVGAVV